MEDVTEASGAYLSSSINSGWVQSQVLEGFQGSQLLATVLAKTRGRCG